MRFVLEHPTLCLEVVYAVCRGVDLARVSELLELPSDGPDGLHPALLRGLPRSLPAPSRAVSRLSALSLLRLLELGSSSGDSFLLPRDDRSRVDEYLTSARVMASETSSERFGSTQTLFTPHLRSSEAILRWFLRFIYHPLLLSTLIPSSSALTSISWRFLMPTEWATLAASSSGLIFSRSLTFHTRTSLNPDG